MSRGSGEIDAEECLELGEGVLISHVTHAHEAEIGGRGDVVREVVDEDAR